MSFCYSYTSEEEKSNKVHSVNSPGFVPFSWEAEPGISKIMHRPQPPPSLETDPKLPPPLCQVVPPKVVGPGLNLPPPPPCGFQQREATKNGYKKRGMKNQDPFLTALVKCSSSVGGHQKDAKKGGASRRGLVGLSCKHSCAVRDGNTVRLPYNGHLLSSSSTIAPNKEKNLLLQKGEARILGPTGM